jgi:tellurite resistance protein
MRLDSATLARLRDELRSRGARVSLPPPSGAPASPASVDVLAIMERVAPICEVLHLLMAADHESDAREQEVLRGTVRALTDGMLKTTVIDAMLARFEAALDAHGRENRLAQVTAQLSADRQDAEAALVLASAMAIADESPDERERAMLEELREQLGISPARARALIGETAPAGLA